MAKQSYFTTLIITILIFIQAIFLFPFLKPGIPLSHDGDGHVARIGLMKVQILM